MVLPDSSELPCVRRVAAVCVSGSSVYKGLEGVDCYDLRRDARTFNGGCPGVFHPPCRSWSAKCAHQAKAPLGEMELGPLCVGWLRLVGGVLEHPAGSRLFGFCGLPLPGVESGACWSVSVSQRWWGCSIRKETWLCFSGVPRRSVNWPLSLDDSRGDSRRWQLMSRVQRSASNVLFAEWLVGVARSSSGGAS